MAEQQTLKTYDVAITETLRKIVTVEAVSKNKAFDMVSTAWENADYILDGHDFVGVEYDIVDEKTEQEV